MFYVLKNNIYVLYNTYKNNYYISNICEFFKGGFCFMGKNYSLYKADKLLYSKHCKRKHCFLHREDKIDELETKS